MKRGIILFFSFLFSCLLNAQLSIQQDTIRYVMANLNLREAPNTTSAIITQIPKGTQVTIDEDCECKWIPVNYNGYIGYVSTKYLSKEKIECTILHTITVHLLNIIQIQRENEYNLQLIIIPRLLEQQLYVEMEHIVLAKAVEEHAHIMVELQNG